MSEENLELDHVLLAVADLQAAAREIEARYGLTSVEGGRHPGWGTANRIVPLGETYLELVTVIDQAEAAQSPFGSWVADTHPALARPLGWAVRTDPLNDVARRLGLAVSANTRRVMGRAPIGGSPAPCTLVGMPWKSRPTSTDWSPIEQPAAAVDTPLRIKRATGGRGIRAGGRSAGAAKGSQSGAGTTRTGCSECGATAG